MADDTSPGPWLPLYVGDYLRDTMHLTTQEHGAYLLLLMAYWSRGEALPDDDRRLAACCNAQASDWQDLRGVLAPFFDIRDGCWFHKRLDKEMTEAIEHRKKMRERGKKAAAARYAQASAQAPAKAVHKHPPPPPPVNNSLNAGAGAREGEALSGPPASMGITPALIGRCKAAGAPTPTQDHVEHFLAHARERGRVSANWEEGLFSWMLREKKTAAIDRQRSTSGGNHGQAATHRKSARDYAREAFGDAADRPETTDPWPAAGRAD